MRGALGLAGARGPLPPICPPPPQPEADPSYFPIFIITSVACYQIFLFFSRVHATLHLGLSVGPSVRPSIQNISKFSIVFNIF